MRPFFITVPHSGEVVPPEAPWLTALPEPTLFRDVDRFVDQLYAPACQNLHIPMIKAEFHRYVVDLNRYPEDVDQESVVGAIHAPGTFTTGFHWVRTTWGETLLTHPLPFDVHQKWVKRYFEPFHAQVQKQFADFEAVGAKTVFHLDAHSMPSQGTKAHRDSGQKRPDIVVSDRDGTSCRSDYAELVKLAYQNAGFEVAYNWPYKGGRITERYGQPSQGHHTLQVEMNRALYMNEETKKIDSKFSAQVQKQVQQALSEICSQIERWTQKV